MTGDGRQAHKDGAHGINGFGFKLSLAARDTISRPSSTQRVGTFSPKQVVSNSVGIMVSAWFLAKVFVAFAPFASAAAQCATHTVLPELLDATADELILGLEAGDFTSLDLVQVSKS